MQIVEQHAEGLVELVELFQVEIEILGVSVVAMVSYFDAGRSVVE